MYYNIKIYKEYSDNSVAKVLNLTTSSSDDADAVLRKLKNSEVEKEIDNVKYSYSISSWSYTLSSVSFVKELSNPNYMAVELTISSITYDSIKGIKESLRSQFVDAEVSLSLIYSKVYDRDKELLLAAKHRVINVHISNISRTGSATTVNVKLDIYSPDYYATLNIHSESFTGKQFGEIVKSSITRFPYLTTLFDEVTSIQKSYNLYYSYTSSSTSEEPVGTPITSNGQKTTTYKITKESNDVVVPHIIPYSVQYNESSYDFLRRLSRRFGETLYFEDGCLRVGIHPKKAAAVSLSSVLSTISFSEQTDSQTSVYVGGNYLTDTTTSFKQNGSVSDSTICNVVNQEVGTDEMNVDILSSINAKWAEDNPQYDDLYLDYIGETDSETDKIDQEDRYDIVTNAIVYWPAITVRLIFQILTFKLTEADKYAEFFLENALSIYESYRLVGEINEGHYEHTETDKYTKKRYFNSVTTTTYTEKYIKPSSNTDSTNKGTAVSGSKTDDVVTGPTANEEIDAKILDPDTPTKKLIAGVRYVDSPRGLAEIMCKSDLALTSFIVKTSAESGRNIVKVVLQTNNDLTSDKYGIVVGLRLGSIVTLDDDDSADRYVVSRINVYNSDASTPVVEIDLLPTVAASYSNIIGEAETSVSYDIEVAIPYFTADDMIRRAEPQRAIVVDVRDSRKLNRARVCYPWQYASDEATAIVAAAKQKTEEEDKKNGKTKETTTEPPVSKMSDGRTLTTLTRFDELKDNLALNASPWLRVSTPGHKGGGTGFVFAPGVATEVMVSYESGNIERPYISGSLFTGPGTALMGQQISDISTFGSRYGRKVMVCDTAVGGGSSILTSFFPFTSLFGLEAKGVIGEALDGYIQIGDQYGLCSLNMSSTTRAISISTPMGKVNISALTGINIIAPSGDITISGKNVNIMAENNLNIMSGTRVGRLRKAAAEYSGKSVRDKIMLGLSKAAMGAGEWAIGELIDLSLVRTIVECFFAPVGGTMVIKSHRYMCIEGGAGRTQMPDSATNKCYISEVLAGFMRIFDPLEDWRYERYVKCYNGLLKEVVGTSDSDKNSLVYKFYAQANGTMNNNGKNLRTYIINRIVAPSAFPPMNGNAAYTFTDDATVGGAGYGQYLTGMVRASTVDANSNAVVKKLQGISNNINRAELTGKLELMMETFNDFIDFYNESATYAGNRDSKETASFIGARLDAIPEKRGVTDGIKYLITNKLFNSVRPTFSEVKNGAANYRLLNQAMYGLPTQRSAAKRVLLLMLMRMITSDILKKYDIDIPNGDGGITSDRLFGVSNTPGAINLSNNVVLTIRDVLANYHGVEDNKDPDLVTVIQSGLSGLVAREVNIVNMNWAALCRRFTLGVVMNKSSRIEGWGETALEVLDSASGLQFQKMANDSWFSLPNIRTDRRKDDTGTILFSGSPAMTVKFNPQTATLEKVQTTENPVDAAFKAAMLSI